MPQDPSILLIPAGAQFLTTPDGTTAPDVAGAPVDLTGVPLTAAPDYATLTGSVATIGGFLSPFLNVETLIPEPEISLGSIPPGVAGKRLQLVGAQEGNVGEITGPGANPGEFILEGLANLTGMSDAIFIEIAGAANPTNNGVFLIASITSNTIAVIINAAAVAEAGLSWRRLDLNGEPLPVTTNTGNAGIFDIYSVSAFGASVVNLDGMGADQWSGDILWNVLPALTDFAPGDPITFIAEQQAIPLNINTPTSGPARFANYTATQQPVGGPPLNPTPVNAGGGNQSAGVSGPSGVGAVVSNDAQNPQRFELSAAIPNNSLGMSQTMQSAPTPTNLGRMVVVRSP